MNLKILKAFNAFLSIINLISIKSKITFYVCGIKYIDKADVFIIYNLFNEPIYYSTGVLIQAWMVIQSKIELLKLVLPPPNCTRGLWMPYRQQEVSFL